MLFSPYALGHLTLPNRIVMPPMTRSRAASGEVATALMAEYYSQRAGAGLIVSEGTQISRQGQGYAWTPGIHSAEQVAGWRQVTEPAGASSPSSGTSAGSRTPRCNRATPPRCPPRRWWPKA